MPPTQPQSRILKWVLIIGIMIVSNLFIHYSVSLVYPRPDQEKYCPTKQVNEPITTQSACVEKGGQWNGGIDQVYTDPSVPTPKPLIYKNPGYCNENFTCQKNYDKARESYDRNIFIILVAAGVVLIIGGFFVRVNAVVSTALSFSGVLSLVIASMRYWSEADNWLRVLILVVALISLIVLAMKKFKG